MTGTDRVTAPPDVLTVGRVSLDLYPAPQPDHLSFRAAVGGSPTNVAVAAARLGLRAAAVTGVGDDAVGGLVLQRLRDHGVDTRWVHVAPGGRTPLALVPALDPPEAPAVAFYREPAAPDTLVDAAAVPPEVVRGARALWVSHTALAVPPLRHAVDAWLDQRARAARTVLDLDHRPALWPPGSDPGRSAREAIARCDVVVGNLAECRTALGTDGPDSAADALLDAGVALAVVKLGADGALLATAQARVRVPARPVRVVCGLGAGDAFGGALLNGLLAGPVTGSAPDSAAAEQWLTAVGRAACDAGAFVAARLTCSDDMPTAADLAAMVGSDGAR